MRRTKILCTIGPATEGEKEIAGLARAGMDAARLNFSHGTPGGHHEVLKRIRKIEGEVKRPIGVIIDLSGPKIRVGDFPGGSITLNDGDEVKITTREGDGSGLPINYPQLSREAKQGDRIFIGDGAIELKVTKATKDSVSTKVISGGVVMPKKGVNLPDTDLSMPSLTEKDVRDLYFGLDIGIDWVALSFVRRADDVVELKKIIEGKNKNVPVLAKIEKAEAIKNIESILDVSDGIIVARGDLGVETPFEDVPLVQKRLIVLANSLGKPVIVATQMLESMIRESRPTRAEVTDVANAVIDGSDCLMLSEETALGNYPINTVSTMARIAEHAEEGLFNDVWHAKVEGYEEHDITGAVCHAAYTTARDLGAAAIITPTSSGITPRIVAQYRPMQPIIALSDNIDTVRRLTLTFGVVSRIAAFKNNLDDVIKTAKDEAISTGLVKKGDTVVITAGSPGGIAGTTNLIRVEVL